MEARISYREFEMGNRQTFFAHSLCPCNGSTLSFIINFVEIDGYVRLLAGRLLTRLPGRSVSVSAGRMADGGPSRSIEQGVIPYLVSSPWARRSGCRQNSSLPSLSLFSVSATHSPLAARKEKLVQPKSRRASGDKNECPFPQIARPFPSCQRVICCAAPPICHGNTSCDSLLSCVLESPDNQFLMVVRNENLHNI